LSAEQLTKEAVAAEEQISRRPELLKLLGLPPALCRVLAEEAPMTPAAGRVIRFDFHYTTQGWRISEANSDVPGGFSEASYFTEMMAEHFPGLRPAGNPADVWSTVNVLPIINALRKGADQLVQLNVPFDAPPAFLLDASRRGDGRKMEPDAFDNRSISFTTDFPSANFLASHGIQRVILVQKNRLEPQSDLAHSLRRWQDGGLKLERLHLDPASPLEPFEVARPSWYGAMFQRALFSIGLRRSGAGGFGAWMPESSAGG